MGADIRKIRTKRKRLNRVTGPAPSREILVVCDRAERVEVLADILVLLKFH
jgi:hypothetical protein